MDNTDSKARRSRPISSRPKLGRWVEAGTASIAATPDCSVRRCACRQEPWGKHRNISTTVKDSGTVASLSNVVDVTWSSKDLYVRAEPILREMVKVAAGSKRTRRAFQDGICALHTWVLSLAAQQQQTESDATESTSHDSSTPIEMEYVRFHPDASPGKALKLAKPSDSIASGSLG
jgi:hypothetical protein